MNPMPNPHGLGQALGHYRSVDAYGAAAGDQVQLVLRMMQGALDRLHAARGHLQRGETAAKGEALGRAVSLIDALRACLDHERGGDISGNLAALYDYMIRQITLANLHNDPAPLAEVAALLGEIREGWETIARQRAKEPRASGAVRA
jgi:flagellar secretion chaperone FliS